MTDDLPKAILFDMDDTVVAFTASSGPAWQAVCRKYATEATGVSPGSLYDAIQESRTGFWSDADRHRRGRLDMLKARHEIVGEALKRLDAYDRDLVTEVSGAYAVIREETVRPFPGAVETLQKLMKEGVLLGLITNGQADIQRGRIERCGLTDLFHAILVEGEFGAGKPDPRVYLHTLQEIGACPEQSWMVGDNLEWEVEAPQKLGMVGVWVDHDHQGLPPSTTIVPDRTVHAIRELLE